ncbi:MAG TPA: class III extradiol ring-cleavage dioxygenase [Candidatus Saccharibacteria bacterium]|nr:class III extradiol ring-cleavage dioxygenase [Candidatus Saccharibacteria bacterium]
MEKLQKLSHTLKPSPKMPVLFVGHGNPMNAILDNDITRHWAEVGKSLPQPQAFVVISAHWLTRGTKITDAPTQPIIYDMYGFPDELYQVKYPAKGDPSIAGTLRDAFLHYEAQLDSSWGLDHGTWSVLKHMAPNVKVPVLQISLDINQSLPQMTEMFKLLKPLREKGVIFIGSGNLVHNLRMLNFHDDKVFDWALEFDTKASEQMSLHNLELLANPRKISSSAAVAVQMDDHYRPMLAAMALLDSSEGLTYFNDVIEMGSIGMRSFIAA